MHAGLGPHRYGSHSPARGSVKVIKCRKMAETHEDTYVPDPRTTFLHEKKVLLCSLCSEIKLQPLRCSSAWECIKNTGTQCPALLPCGHVACFSCLGKCDEGRCPFCRRELIRTLCPCGIAPREVSLSN